MYLMLGVTIKIQHRIASPSQFYKLILLCLLGQKLLGAGGIDGLIEENNSLEQQLELLEKDTVSTK